MYQPLPTLQFLEHMEFSFPAEQRLRISKEEKEAEAKELVSMSGPGINAPPQPEVIPEPAPTPAKEEKKTRTPEQEAMVQKFLAEHKHGVVRVVWVSVFFQHRMNAHVCDVWFAPNDKRNFRCKPPSKPYTKMRAYLAGIYFAMIKATEPAVFEKGAALAVCVDDADAIKAIFEEGGKDQRVRKLAERLWKQNGSQVTFILNGIRVPSGGAMFEESVLAQSTVIAQRSAQKVHNIEMRKRERATCLADLIPARAAHQFMNPEELGRHHYASSIAEKHICPSEPIE